MAQDKRCPFNINGLCYEKVAHGFSEKQLRESNEINPCEMGQYNGLEIERYTICSTFRMFETARETPGIINPEMVEAIRQAKYNGIVDGQRIDLQTTLK